MRVDHRRLQTPMPEQELDRTDVGAGGQQVRCKAVAQTMNARVLSDFRPLDCLFEGPLNCRVRCMPTHLSAVAAPRPQDRGRKHILPGQGCRSRWVLPGQCIRHGRQASAGRQVIPVQSDYAQEMLLQGRHQSFRQYRGPILAALAVANRHRLCSQIDILDPQANAFMYAQPGTIDEFRHQARRTHHLPERLPEYFPIEEHDGIERL